MTVHCPSCRAEFAIPEEKHYREVLCPKCGNKFEAISPATEQISRDFLDQILRDFEKKPE